MSHIHGPFTIFPVNSQMNDNAESRLTRIDIRCAFAGSELWSLKNDFTRDIASCVRDVKRLRAAVLNIKDFADANSDEFCSDLTFNTRDLLLFYTACDDLTGGLKKKLRRLESSVCEGIEVSSIMFSSSRSCQRHAGMLFSMSRVKQRIVTLS